MTTNAQINQVVALLRIGELAMQMFRADADLKRARDEYYGGVKKFEDRFAGGRRLKVDSSDPMYTRRRLYTREEFLELESAKRKAYRAKRKLRLACEKIAAPVNAGGAK
jgi:hypothetical protein